MTRKRRVFTASFKARVALAAERGDKTTAELAAKFGVHPAQVTSWKKQLLDSVAELFEDGRRSSKSNDASVQEQELFEQIGRLKMGLEWLKKKSAELG